MLSHILDLIGLIDGASENKGLGFEFLKHIERTKVLLYVIDMSGTSDKGNNKLITDITNKKGQPKPHDPVADFLSLRNELMQYDPALLDKPSFVFANKIDITGTC